MDMQSMDHLSKVQLLTILDFMFSSRQVTERQGFYEMLNSLGRNILHCDNLLIGRCSASSHEGAGPALQCSGIDAMLTIDADAPRAAQDMCGSHLTHPPRRCGDGCSSGSTLDEMSADRSVAVVCDRKGGDSLCLVSVAKRGESLASDEAILKELAPYIQEAFTRLPAENDAAESLPPTKFKSDTQKIWLTPREREILQWIAQGKGCWEAGSIVGISERTVKFHLQNVYRKLDVLNRTQAIVKAMQYNLI